MRTLIATLVFALCTLVPATTLADGHTTLRVVAVSTDDVGDYVDELKKGKAMISRIAPKMEMRAWQATFAGEETGRVIVALEYPGSLAAFASAWEKTLADKKIAAWLAGLGDIRELISDSIYRELSL